MTQSIGETIGILNSCQINTVIPAFIVKLGHILAKQEYNEEYNDILELFNRFYDTDLNLHQLHQFLISKTYFENQFILDPVLRRFIPQQIEKQNENLIEQGIAPAEETIIVDQLSNYQQYRDTGFDKSVYPGKYPMLPYDQAIKYLFNPLGFNIEIYKQNGDGSYSTQPEHLGVGQLVNPSQTVIIYHKLYDHFDLAKEVIKEKDLLAPTNGYLKIYESIISSKDALELDSSGNNFTEESYTSVTRDVSKILNTDLKTLTQTEVGLFLQQQALQPAQHHEVNLPVPPEENIDDISKLPRAIPIEPATEINVGDLHGNGMKLLFILFKHGIASGLTKDEYQQLSNIYDGSVSFNSGFTTVTLTSEQIQRFNQLLDKIKWKPINLLRLLGDETADRGNNDYFTLKIFECMGKNHVPFEILISNHGVEFINAYETKTKFERFNLEKQHGISLDNLQVLIDQNIITREEVMGIVEHVYKPNLRAISCSLDTKTMQMNVFSHAGIGLETIASLAKKLQVPYLASTAEELAQTVYNINAKFQENVRTNTVHQLYDNDTMYCGYGGREALNASESPFEFTMWNRFYHSIERPSSISDYHLFFVHGHDSSEKTHSNIVNLDNNFGKFPKNHIHASHNTDLYEAYLTQNHFQPLMQEELSISPSAIQSDNLLAPVSESGASLDSTNISPLNLSSEALNGLSNHVSVHQLDEEPSILIVDGDPDQHPSVEELNSQPLILPSSVDASNHHQTGQIAPPPSSQESAATITQEKINRFGAKFAEIFIGIMPESFSEIPFKVENGIVTVPFKSPIMAFAIEDAFKLEAKVDLSGQISIPFQVQNLDGSEPIFTDEQLKEVHKNIFDKLQELVLDNYTFANKDIETRITTHIKKLQVDFLAKSTYPEKNQVLIELEKLHDIIRNEVYLRQFLQTLPQPQSLKTEPSHPNPIGVSSPPNLHNSLTDSSTTSIGSANPNSNRTKTVNTLSTYSQLEESLNLSSPSVSHGTPKQFRVYSDTRSEKPLVSINYRYKEFVDAEILNKGTTLKVPETGHTFYFQYDGKQNASAILTRKDAGLTDDKPIDKHVDTNRQNICYDVMNMIENVLAKSKQIHIKTKDPYVAAFAEKYIDYLKSEKKLEFEYSFDGPVKEAKTETVQQLVNADFAKLKESCDSNQEWAEEHRQISLPKPR
jgi:hypothetical protein